MAFELKNTVPWGRNLDEYKNIFHLTDSDLDKRIISFGDGPASFNAEMTSQGKSVVSIDPVYRFTEEELRQRINETKDIVIEQMKNNFDNFVWTSIKNIQELEDIRLSAMNNFLQDFKIGKENSRYINHELPNRTVFRPKDFDLALSSHFLVLYSQLGLNFHIESVKEMLRVATEIRIFPLLNLNAEKSEILDGLIEYFNTEYSVSIEKVDYEFQKNGNEMLRITEK
jgi:hypothetical protein